MNGRVKDYSVVDLARKIRKPLLLEADGQNIPKILLFVYENKTELIFALNADRVKHLT